uniref:Uncharacterized protein n=1 Tax=Romanomermis culicivorax TaxID=13658 RepID=A0A915HFI0_ROMCU
MPPRNIGCKPDNAKSQSPIKKYWENWNWTHFDINNSQLVLSNSVFHLTSNVQKSSTESTVRVKNDVRVILPEVEV